MSIPSHSAKFRRDIGFAVGEALAKRRMEAGLTQWDLAQLVGIGDESVSRIERGVAMPAFIRFHDFAWALGCGVSALALPGAEAPGDEAALVAAELEGLPPAARKRLLRALVDGARFERENLSRK